MSREVMQQALEAIEPVMAYGRPGTRDVEQAVLQKAHTALRAALAEQAEPVAWQWLDTSTFRKRLPSNAEPGAWRPLYAAHGIK